MAVFIPTLPYPVLPGPAAYSARWHGLAVCSRALLGMYPNDSRSYVVDLTFNGVTEKCWNNGTTGLIACSASPAGYFKKISTSLQLDVMQARADGVWAGSVTIPISIGNAGASSCSFFAGIFTSASSAFTSPRPVVSWTGAAPFVSSLCVDAGRGYTSSITVDEYGNITVP